jgi:hypothetical protein
MNTIWWIILGIIVLGLVSLGIILLLCLNVGHTTKKEKNMSLPGDYLLEKERAFRDTNAITINAAPSQIWPYIVQMCRTKAGFYSYQFFENMVGCDIHNVYEIKPEWQHIKKGDWKFFHKGGVGVEVVDFKENEYLIGYSDSRKPCKVKGSKPYNPFNEEMAYSWVFVLRELSPGKTRMILRCDVHFAPRSILRWAFLAITQGIPAVVMQQKLKRTVKALVEDK